MCYRNIGVGIVLAHFVCKCVCVLQPSEMNLSHAYTKRKTNEQLKKFERANERTNKRIQWRWEKKMSVVASWCQCYYYMYRWFTWRSYNYSCFYHLYLCYTGTTLCAQCAHVWWESVELTKLWICLTADRMWKNVL